MTPQIKENLYEIATENAEELYEQFGAEGVWVTEDDLPSDPSEFTEEERERVLSSERIAAIENGDQLSDAELHDLREHRLDKMLLDEVDADSIPAYCLAEVTDAEDNSGIALIFCKGYSFSVLRIWVGGIFDTKEAAKAYLEENGWVSW
jgi:hypothetical protein